MRAERHVPPLSDPRRSGLHLVRVPEEISASTGSVFFVIIITPLIVTTHPRYVAK